MNSTPKASAAVIALVLKRYWRVIVIPLAILIFLFGFLYERDVSYLSIKSQRFGLEVAATEDARELGLAGRESLGSKQAMLFVFDKPDMRCFWMKDMRFDIDMVWLDANKKVVGIEQNATPSSYPTNFCHGDAQYVVELAAGTAARLQLHAGDVLQSSAW